VLLIRFVGCIAALVIFVPASMYTVFNSGSHFYRSDYFGSIVEGMFGLSIVVGSVLLFVSSWKGSWNMTRSDIKVASVFVAAGLVSVGTVSFPIYRMLLHMEINGFEESAMGTLGTIMTSEKQYQSSLSRDENGYGIGDFGTFSDLLSAQPPFIDKLTAGGEKSGYIFTLDVYVGRNEADARYTATAVPKKRGKTGNRIFLLDSSAPHRGAHAVRFTTDGSMPNASSPVATIRR